MLIGVSGYAQAGKDSVGLILVENHGFKRTAFADRMRQMALAINPIIDFAHEGFAGRPVRLDEIVSGVGWERAKKNEEVRSLLQKLGTDGGRVCLGEDVWVRATLRSIAKKANWVITDVRFPNEAAAIIARKGTLVRIVRPHNGPANGHVSERALDNYNFDYKIDNDGTLVELEEMVKHFVQLVALRDGVAVPAA